ncbi:MAG: hydrogenase nickel incorporation protein HypA [Pelotomaculum sp.]|uniref:Hydrogenase maturation factor HypA n=1 Tax=Pelotomaculum thermopropionicum (strain DSM 13744 / JCM 10971 / SI) TaxID=370438 RepID=A5D1K3_PELTS|nr:hydrogenase nickel incorporation protein HypA [Pelotomaculum sp.]BAF59875.1 Zn finger protein HypA/HybF [Pelotomaculum thermopropionicum SI]
MHEWALAEAVVEAVIKEAEKESLKEILKVKLMVGELQQVDLDVFTFSLEKLTESYNSILSMDKFIIEIEKSLLKCRVCENCWSYGQSLKELADEQTEAIHFVPEVAHVYMRCPQCGSPDFEIVKGRGLWIEYIEGEK